MKKKAVILLSGGLDSATTTAIASLAGFELYALSFIYGQRHDIEIQYAKKIVDFYKIKKHVIIAIHDEIFLNTSLLKSSLNAVPRKRDIVVNQEIPSTYVPARNILFLSYALSFAESISAYSIFIGVNALDYSGYPDCRPEFIKAFEKMANLGTKTGVLGKKISIETPLIGMSKSEIIKKGIQLGVDYSMTHSCYNPDKKGRACGECDSCILRKNGFKNAGVDDPIKYV